MERGDEPRRQGGHPTGPAIALLVGVTILIVLLSLASIQGWP